MSRIGSYHDLSIYTSNRKSVPSQVQSSDTPFSKSDQPLNTNNASVTISQGGKNALLNSKKVEAPPKIAEKPSATIDKSTSIPTIDYRSRLATQSYQEQANFSSASTTN